MALPHDPEPISQLQARYAAALEPVYVQWKVARGNDRPGLHREHVMDFESGLRLIVSRERTDKGKVVIHVSASPESNSHLWHRCRDAGSLTRGLRILIDEAVASFRRISGDDRQLQLVDISSPAMIPHWLIEGE